MRVQRDVIFGVFGFRAMLQASLSFVLDPIDVSQLTLSYPQPYESCFCFCPEGLEAWHMSPTKVPETRGFRFPCRQLRACEGVWLVRPRESQSCNPFADLSGSLAMAGVSLGAKPVNLNLTVGEATVKLQAWGRQALLRE
jgi:hypothetical protein